MRILLVEDDKELGSIICKALSEDGSAVDWLEDGKSAIDALSMKMEKFDIIILDIGLPIVDGLSVLRTMRKAGMTTPVMLLTARDTTLDRVTGLDSGSDDYLVKPFELDELCARLRALHRRFNFRAAPAIIHGNIALDPAAHTVTLNNEPLNLPRREFALLQKLLENAGHVLTRETLIQTLYGWNEDVDSNTLEVHIHNIRKKISSSFIRTIRGVGYMIDKAP